MPTATATPILDRGGSKSGRKLTHRGQSKNPLQPPKLIIPTVTVMDEARESRSVKRASRSSSEAGSDIEVDNEDIDLQMSQRRRVVTNGTHESDEEDVESGKVCDENTADKTVIDMFDESILPANGLKDDAIDPVLDALNVSVSQQNLS